MTNRQTYRHTDRDYCLAGKVSYVYIDIKLFLFMYFPFPCLGKSFNPFMSLKLIRDRFIILKTFFFYNYPEIKISHNNVMKIIPHSLLNFILLEFKDYFFFHFNILGFSSCSRGPQYSVFFPWQKFYF